MKDPALVEGTQPLVVANPCDDDRDERPLPELVRGHVRFWNRSEYIPAGTGRYEVYLVPTLVSLAAALASLLGGTRGPIAVATVGAAFSLSLSRQSSRKPHIVEVIVENEVVQTEGIDDLARDCLFSARALLHASGDVYSGATLWGELAATLNRLESSLIQLE